MAKNTLYLDWVRDVLDTGAKGLREITAALDHDFVRAAEASLHCKSRVAITGMGKFGRIGRKMATAMASTGTPAFLVRLVEAVHGDLSMIVGHDVVIVISNSSKNDEVTAVIPALRRKNIMLICITAHPTSTMARHADAHIIAAVSKEVRPFSFMPTSNTIAVMALGNALAVVLLRVHAFTLDDFALSHPAGSLGKYLLSRVADIIHEDEALSAVLLGTLLKEAIVCMNERGLGMLAVTDVEGRLEGVFTDDDLCRLFQERDSLVGLKVDDIMHASPKTTSADRLTTEALKAMQGDHVNGLLMAEEDDVLIGALNMHDSLMARIV